MGSTAEWRTKGKGQGTKKQNNYRNYSSLATERKQAIREVNRAWRTFRTIIKDLTKDLTVPEGGWEC